VEVSGQLHASAALSPEKESVFYGRQGGLQSQLDTMEKKYFRLYRVSNLDPSEVLHIAHSVH
jgi:hypothetical protein